MPFAAKKEAPNPAALYVAWVSFSTLDVPLVKASPHVFERVGFE